MKNVHEYNKMCPYINKITILQQRGAVSLCEEGVLNTSYALRRQTIFSQIIPARENDKKYQFKH